MPETKFHIQTEPKPAVSTSTYQEVQVAILEGLLLLVNFRSWQCCRDNQLGSKVLQMLCFNR
jgi:hypothetical protein